MSTLFTNTTSWQNSRQTNLIPWCLHNGTCNGWFKQTLICHIPFFTPTDLTPLAFQIRPKNWYIADTCLMRRSVPDNQYICVCANTQQFNETAGQLLYLFPPIPRIEYAWRVHLDLWPTCNTHNKVSYMNSPQIISCEISDSHSGDGKLLSFGLSRWVQRWIWKEYVPLKRR